jgi:hemerythrin
MSVFNWNEKFNVGVESIDKQHKHFLVLLNNLNEEIQLKKDEKAVDTAIDNLFSYAKIHFRNEEKILVARGYTKIDEQRQEHRLFLTRLKEMEVSNQGANRLLMGSVASFARDWFIQHITVEDQKYARAI